MRISASYALQVAFFNGVATAFIGLSIETQRWDRVLLGLSIAAIIWMPIVIKVLRTPKNRV
jgi:hypothetical protein